VLYSSEVQQPQQPALSSSASERTCRDLYDRPRPFRLELRIRRLQVRILPSAHRSKPPPDDPDGGFVVPCGSEARQPVRRSYAGPPVGGGGCAEPTLPRADANWASPHDNDSVCRRSPRRWASWTGCAPTG
jgi:hypothetical protein